jgi:16S rRNA (uracil1498-N3)-methyltransferase
MSSRLRKIRLYLPVSLTPGQPVELPRDQAHYLSNVMRCEVGEQITVFNGKSGAFTASVIELNKRRAAIEVLVQTALQQDPPDLWLVFAPIKKARTDFIVEKATEMGAARILPVQTQYTNADRLKQDRLQAHAVEAAEQCAGTFVPEVEAMTKLQNMMDAWPSDRGLMFCDERLVGQKTGLSAAKFDKWAILIGPEGGFSEAEQAKINALPQSVAVSLGPRVLRADTAVVAAMTLWQTTMGDWQ